MLQNGLVGQKRTSPMIAADITRMLEPNAPAKMRQTSIVAMSLASAVPNVKSVKMENVARKMALLPNSSDSGP